MADEKSQDRNQPATARRRKKFRDRGETPRSREVATVVLVLAGAGSVALLGPGIGARLGGLMQEIFSGLDRLAPVNALASAVFGGARLLAPVFLVFVVVALAAHVCQGNLAFSPKVLRPKWERINPFSRAKQLLFSRRTVTEVVKALGKAIIIGGLTAWFVVNELPEGLALARSQPSALGRALGSITIRMGVYGALALSAVALADLLMSRWDLEKRMKMTRQEVREEQKEQDGDPLLRSRRRRRHRELSMNKVLKEVPQADVVVTNPTHLAVALRYDRKKWASPRVTAKGQDHLAIKIRALARQHSVPLMEDKPLARSLYRTVRVGQAVHKSLYQAVAEIYAFLYRTRQGSRR